jgi:hypothetical protein
MTTARADVENLRLRDAIDPAAQSKDDFVGELVGDHSRRLGSCNVGVLLP